MRLPLLVLVLLSPLVLPVTQADTVLGQVIVGDEVWEGDWTLRQNVIVPAGASLTLRDGTFFLDAARTCTGRTNIPALYQCHPQLQVAGGTLIVENATLDSHLWDGSVDGGFVLEVQDGAARIRNSTLQRYRQLSFVAVGPSPTIIEGNVFQVSNGPIRFMQGVEATFRGNVVQDGRDGVWVSDATVPIEDNRFRRLDKTFDGGTARYGIWVFASSPQDRAWRTLGPIRGNIVEDVPLGILLQHGDPAIVERNIVRNVTRGISVNLAPDGIGLARNVPTVRENVVQDAQHGITIGGITPIGPAEAANRTLDLSGNTLLDIACHDVWVRPLPQGMTLRVDATGAWWGTAEGPTPTDPACASVRLDTAAATVDVEPWLTHEPKWVKAQLKLLAKE